MAHRSWCSETGAASNERLEFLGDAVLGLVVTAFIYGQYPNLPEGDLAKLRASVVNAIVLAEVADELDLGSSLLLGKGEDATGGRQKASILSDALEAVIGAVYLDGGWEPAAALVMRIIGDRIAEYAEGPGGSDYKTRLQELAAREFEQLPLYRVTGAGPDHAKSFEAQVLIGGELRGSGGGRSKKQAEQAAAKVAWESLRELAPPRPTSSAAMTRVVPNLPAVPNLPSVLAAVGKEKPSGNGVMGGDQRNPTSLGDPIEPVDPVDPVVAPDH